MKSLHKILILLFCFLLLFSCDICSPTESDDPNVVTFSDINFEILIRDILNKQGGDITKSDLLTITQLEGWAKGINNIDGIEYCKNLEYLNLHNNQISDISVLAGLTNLTGLILSNNQINDISTLTDLMNIETLFLSDNQISDISGLTGLTNIVSVSLKHNQISDISALTGLTSLEVLSLWDNQISNISALAGLTNLNYLILAANQITDIYPLVQNLGVDTGDRVELWSNPISETSINTYIPQLEARGVDIVWWI